MKRFLIGVVVSLTMLLGLAMLLGYHFSSKPTYHNDGPVTISGISTGDSRERELSGMQTSPGGVAVFGIVVAENKGTRPATLLRAALTADKLPAKGTVQRVGLYDFQTRNTETVGVGAWPRTELLSVDDGDLGRLPGFVLQPGKAVNLVFRASSDTPGVHRWDRVRMSYRYGGKTKTDEVWSGFQLCVSRACPEE